MLQGLAREINEAKAGTCFSRAAELGAVFRELAAPLGICQLEPEQWCRLPMPGGARAAAFDDAAIEAAVAARLAARKARNFRESDRLRDELAAAGVVLEDGPSGTSWRRK